MAQRGTAYARFTAPTTQATRTVEAARYYARGAALKGLPFHTLYTDYRVAAEFLGAAQAEYNRVAAAKGVR
ncbi:MAG: hypothetical protein A2Y38_16935 [Spirochaetes bacterium GWB1_59_5]|nr:MAG: hypothetical protein A2Y38_16935 [Spirochaetes bacterium GWB1_59_5]